MWHARTIGQRWRDTVAARWFQISGAWTSCCSAAGLTAHKLPESHSSGSRARDRAARRSSRGRGRPSWHGVCPVSRRRCPRAACCSAFRSEGTSDGGILAVAVHDHQRIEPLALELAEGLDHSDRDGALMAEIHEADDLDLGELVELIGPGCSDEPSRSMVEDGEAQVVLPANFGQIGLEVRLKDGQSLKPGVTTRICPFTDYRLPMPSPVRFSRTSGSSWSSGSRSMLRRAS